MRWRWRYGGVGEADAGTGEEGGREGVIAEQFDTLKTSDTMAILPVALRLRFVSNKYIKTFKFSVLPFLPHKPKVHLWGRHGPYLCGVSTVTQLESRALFSSGTDPGERGLS